MADSHSQGLVGQIDESICLMICPEETWRDVIDRKPALVVVSTDGQHTVPYVPADTTEAQGAPPLPKAL
ncbi:hypothetical protein P7K49_020978, partial [Saguinus oedipus]